MSGFGRLSRFAVVVSVAGLAAGTAPRIDGRTPEVDGRAAFDRLKALQGR